MILKTVFSEINHAITIGQIFKSVQIEAGEYIVHILCTPVGDYYELAIASQIYGGSVIYRLQHKIASNTPFQIQWPLHLSTSGYILAIISSVGASITSAQLNLSCVKVIA